MRDIRRLPPANPAEYHAGLASTAFLEFLAGRLTAPALVWEPFASSYRSRLADACAAKSLNYRGFGLCPVDLRVTDGDATADEHPVGAADAILFNPPYFGGQPFSADQRDLSRCDEKEYGERLERAARFTVAALRPEQPGAFILSIGRAFAFRGKLVNLTWWFANLFEANNLTITEVVGSLPDVGVVLQRKQP